MKLIYSMGGLFGLSLLLTLVGCSSREGFSQVKLTNSSWWYCAGKSARSWHCAESQQALAEMRQAAAAMQPIEDKPKVSEPVTSLDSDKSFAEETAAAANHDAVTANAFKEKDEVKEKAEQQLIMAENVIATNEQPINRAPESINGAEATWLIQVAAFQTLAQAERLAQQLTRAQIESFNKNGQNWYRVYLGYYPSRQAAVAAAADLQGYQLWIRQKH